MKVTKYPQSCFRLEEKAQAIMIDIGNLATAKYKLEDFGPFEALLITHQHADHIDPELAGALKGLGVPIYANADVQQKFPELDITVTQHGQTFGVAGFHITPYDLPHCRMVDGSDGPPNTGYVIDEVFFHPGDGVSIEGLKVNTLAAPIAGPSVSILDAVQLTRQVGATKVIPMHYDNPVFYNDPSVFKGNFTEAEIIVLNNGESTEI